MVSLGSGCSSGLAVLTIETLDTSGGVHDLVLACVERVAVGADIDFELALDAASLENVSTSARNFTWAILRVNGIFHDGTSFLASGVYTGRQTCCSGQARVVIGARDALEPSGGSTEARGGQQANERLGTI